jgi:ubiquitin C-terminal hydrolase
MFNTINSGHYTSIVINRHNNTWYEFDDDDDLTVVNEEDLVNRNAYMLFYYRNN